MDAIGTSHAAALPSRRVASASVAPRVRSLVLIMACIALSGCSFGAVALERSVGPYNEAVTRVSEEQLLLNLVRLRYNDNPTRLDVASIAAQYEIDGTLEAKPFFQTPNPAGS